MFLTGDRSSTRPPSPLGAPVVDERAGSDGPVRPHSAGDRPRGDRRAWWVNLVMLSSALLLTSVPHFGDRAGSPEPARAQELGPAHHIFLALVANGAPRSELSRPEPGRPAATSTLPGPAPSRTSPAATATATPQAKPTLRACQAPLERRLFTRPFGLDGRSVQQPRGGGWWTHNPLITAPMDDSRAWVGWSADDEVRYTPILGLGRRAGPDFVYPRGESTHGGLSHEDGGGAALIRHGRIMSLVRWEADGSLRFDTELVGTEGSGAGSKWIDDWPHEGRLIWDGEVYAAYFGHTQSFGARGRHQGDLLWLIDGEGRRLDPDDLERSRHPWWDWGCSHSIDLRMVLHPTLGRLGTVCLSDAYPSPGFVFERSLLINQEPSADGNGGVDALLGGLAPASEGFALTYVSGEGRRSLDVALRRIYDDENDIGPPWWLTDSPDVDESSAHLARYGEDLLAGWTASDRLHLAVVSQRGVILEGPVAVEAKIAPRDDFVLYPNGDVGWTYAQGTRESLISARVQLCRRVDPLR